MSFGKQLRFYIFICHGLPQSLNSAKRNLTDLLMFKFSKEIVETYALSGHGYYRNVRLYKVFNNHVKIGEFIQFNDSCLINFSEQAIRIQKGSSSFAKSKHTLFDEKTQIQIGEYSVPGWIHQYGKLILKNETYYCQKLIPDIKYSIFRKNTWGHYKIQVSNGTSSAIYKFKINEPFLTFSNKKKFRPFFGEIELSNGNLLLLFAGLFLLDVVIDKEDTSLTG